MKSLDDKTLDKIAALICGDFLSTKYCNGDDYNCPFYRTGSQLTQFFQNTGLDEIHDGSGRKNWTLERLIEYNEDPSKIEMILLRLAHPLEYHDIDDTKTIIKEMNNLLFAEGLEVSLNGNMPYIHNINGSIPNEEVNKDKPFVKVNFNGLIDDPKLLNVLELRWTEIEICSSNGAYLSTIILLGSILEGILLSVVQKNPEKANKSNSAPRDGTERVLNFNNWTLNNLINVTHDCGWIDKDIKDFNSSLRDYRNLVHPRKQRDENVFPDEDTCRICVEVVRAALNDLKNNYKL